MKKTEKQTVILESDSISENITNIVKSIHKKHNNFKNLVFAGILSAGYPLANRIAKQIKKEYNAEIPVGKLDVALYRDDLLSRGKFVTIRESDIPFDLNGKTLVIVDDVLYNGRTIRAALNAMLDFGRPASIELAVLVDRGHRELPIFANHIGSEIKTNKLDHITIKLYEIDGEDSVILE
jgi:pyrimidine operon attenuation protein / uracil phosphoribosyltransferase